MDIPNVCGLNKIELFYVEKSEGLGFVYQLHVHQRLVLILSFLLLSSMRILYHMIQNGCLTQQRKKDKPTTFKDTS